MSAAAMGVGLLCLAGLLHLQAARGQPQHTPKLEPPKWLADEGKDLFTDVEAEESYYGDRACEMREKLLKHMAGKGEKDAADHRAKVLLGLGLCEFKRGNFDKSRLRIDSCVSELNLPSEDIILQNPAIAPIGLMRQAAQFMAKFEVTQAGTALRRCREVLDRNIRKLLKQVHKQMGQQGSAPPLEQIYDDLPGYGKTGQFLPTILAQLQAPIFKQDLGWLETLDTSLDDFDRRIGTIDSATKQKRLRLDLGKKGKSGSMLYVRMLPMEAVVPAEQSTAAEEFLAAGGARALLEEAAAAEKGATLLKRAKDGSGCKDDKGGMPKLCAALRKVADVASNGFGETRLVIAKAGKKVQLDTCSTNANIGLVVAAKDGASLTVAGAEAATPLKAGEPAIFDFCREAGLEAPATTPVLVAQAWHPEFAAVERTTELRGRAKAFGLSEDDVKAAAKAVNDHAKKAWEKGSKAWRKDSAGLEQIRQALKAEVEEKEKQEEAAREAKKKEEEASDEERQKALAALEKKREEKRKADEAAEKARLERKKKLEAERAARDPWLNSPEVKKAEEALEELKGARRDANAKLEFDLSTQLTKDISAAERHLKKVTKQARKAWKKGAKAEKDGQAEKSDKSADKEDEPAEEPPKSATAGQAAILRKELADVKEKKLAASKAENFKAAKKLKQEEKELEEKLARLEL